MGEQNKTAEKWVMVPVEPTEEMCAAWDKSGACDLKPEHFDEYPGDEWVRKNANLDWKAMLAAAPKVEPAQQATNAAGLIIRDVCEMEPANPNLNDTICIDVSDLLRIVKRHIGREKMNKAAQLWETIKILGLSNERLALQAIEATFAAQQAPAQPLAKVVREGLTEADKEIIAAVIRELDECDDGNAPGHAHKAPGIWDSDNGARAGKPCAWCLCWKKFTALAAAHGIPATGGEGAK